jgi:hypothetical protein
MVMQAADQGMRHDARPSRVFELSFRDRISHVEYANQAQAASSGPALDRVNA